MKFCKKCGTLYGRSLDVCPKCNAAQLAEEATAAEISQSAAAESMVKKQWIGILVGVPAFIIFIYFIIWCFKMLTA